MKIISSKPKGQIIKKCTTRPFWIEPIIKEGESLLLFNTETGEWGKKGNTSVYCSMTYDGFNDAYSLKAVKRLVAKWNVPKGTKFRASLPFVGYDFFITK